MEGMMDPSSAVTLVVKTPNRSIDDLQINCALNWTVEKLKRHLSSVYPSKPESTKQRLIYSGQLLLDHQTLQEFLREHQDGKLHTLHLVCPPSSNESSPSTSSTSMESNASSSSTNIPSTPTTSTTTQPTNDGLRYRGFNTPPQPMFMPRPAMWSPGNIQQPFQPPSFPAPVQQQQHQLWMQYMQQMYQQHQMAAANYQRTNPMFMMPNMQIPYWPYQRLPGQVTPIIPPQSPTQAIPQTPPPAQPAAAQPAQQAPAPPGQQRNNQELRMNAQGGVADDDDEENVNNDWLDKIYTLCRVVILLSIVWFYSSTSRFLMMIGSVLLIYMYQWGAFHWLFRNGVQQNQRVEVHLPPPQQQEQEQQQQQEHQSQQDHQDNAEQGENNSEEDGQVETPEPEPAPPPPPAGPSTLRIIVSFISTFFTSLIPQNNEVVQGN